MSDNLNTWLNPTATEVVASRIISERFVDENGNPVPFKVKSITQEENQRLVSRATPVERDRNGNVKPLNQKLYTNLLLVECCVEPDFKREEICQRYGVVNPIDVPHKMLLTGEYAKLVTFTMETCGFKNTDDLMEEAKNS